MDTDRNLLFGVLALQADLISSDQFIQACTLWTTRKNVPLADLLVEQGWLTLDARADVEHLLERKLKKHRGDALASLAEVVQNYNPAQRLLAVLDDSAIQQSMDNASRVGEHVKLSTVNDLPETRKHYTLTRLHAKGGIGQVWLARDGSLGREVALKELLPGRTDHPAIWARFLKEAQVTGQLEHPGIVPIYELARRPEDQQPFYTMRFIRGRTLSEAIKVYHEKRKVGQASTLELRALLSAFIGVCNAVAYAHARGVIHRDLKGANVVLGDYGEVIVLDWGLAKVLDRAEGETDLPPIRLDQENRAEATLQGQVMGSPAYMAPEQAVGRPDLVNERTDVYGLGAILYEILTGQPPFTGTDALDVLSQVCANEPARPREVAVGVPAALEAICLRALAKERAARYASATELAAEVQRWLADEPVAAYRDSLATRLGRWARRHKPLVAGVAALLVTAVVALTISTVLIGHQKKLAESERDRADASFQLARSAVDDYFTKVSDSDELKAHDLEQLRKKLLESAQKFYEQFIQERRNDPGLQADLGRAYNRLAKITSEIASRNDAVHLYQGGRGIFERLVREQPANAFYRRDLAASHADMGSVYAALGQTAAAEQAFLQALPLLDELVRDFPTESQFRQDLATCRFHLGDLYVALGKMNQAEEAYKMAALLYEELAREEPSNPRYQRDQAAIHHNLGNLYKAIAKLPEAIAALERGPLLLTRLARAHPSVPQYQRDLAASYGDLGTLYLHTGKTDKAKECYLKALPILDKLAREHPSITSYRRDLALTYGNLGIAHTHMGKLDAAEKADNDAVSVLEKLVREHPTTPEFQHELAQCRQGLGNLLRRKGNLDQAEEAYKKAINLLDPLAVAKSTIPLYQRSLAACYGDLAIVYKEMGKPDPAKKAYQQALALFDKLARDNPSTWHYQRDRALTYSNFGNLCVEIGEISDAEEAFRRAIAAQEKMARDHPQLLQLTAELGATYLNMGNLWIEQRKAQTALEWFARAVPLLEDSLRRDPNFALAKYLLSHVHWGQADALTHLGRHADAMKEWETAIALDNGKDRAKLRSGRATTLARMGEHAQAMAEVDKLAVDQPVAADTYYQLALVGCWASVAVRRDAKLAPTAREKLAEQYGARAVELLAKAHAAGYFKSTAVIEKLRKEPEFEPLRSRTDYRKFLLELEKKP
jgi:serine/threonine-protein kinase